MQQAELHAAGRSHLTYISTDDARRDHDPDFHLDSRTTPLVFRSIRDVSLILW